MISRAEIQAQIDQIRKDETIKLSELKSVIGVWLDKIDLSWEGLTHEFMREHILDDLNSYEGVEE